MKKLTTLILMQSLVSFIEEIEFEKRTLKKLNKQIETGIISYHNPRVDSAKDINNSWVCNFKAKYLYINSDYKSDFEKDVFNFDEARTSQHYGIKFDGGLPRTIQNRKISLKNTLL